MLGTFDSVTLVGARPSPQRTDHHNQEQQSPEHRDQPPRTQQPPTPPFLQALPSLGPALEYA